MSTRPRPPRRVPSTRHGDSVSVNSPEVAGSVDSSNTGAVNDAQSRAHQTLNHKLSSSSLSMSLPPDSPPEIFDYPHGLLHAPSQSSTAAAPWSRINSRDKVNKLDNDGSPMSRKTLDRAAQASSASSTSCLAHVTSVPSISSRSDAYPELDEGASWSSAILLSGLLGGSATGTPSSLTYNPLTKDQVERIFRKADTLIQAKDQELTLFSTAGQGLRQEHHTVQDRHHSLLSGSPANLSPSASPTRRDVRSVFANISTSPSTSRASVMTAGDKSPGPSSRPSNESLTGYGDLPENNYTSSSSASPATPLRSSSISARRKAKGVPASMSSSPLFGSEPRRAGMACSPVPHHELQALSQANYSLTMKLTELEADSERSEQTGKRKLRRLQRELAALKQELERVEARNNDLEAATGAPGIAPSPWRTRDDLPIAQPRRERRIRSPPRSGDEAAIASAASANIDADAPAPSTPAPVPKRGIRRSPGYGTPRVLRNETEDSKRDAAVDATSTSLTSAPTVTGHHLVQPNLVAQLLAKIEELQDAKSTIEEERAELDDKLQRATKEMDAFKQRCEELEELRSTEWDVHRGTIEWHRADSQDIGTPCSDVDLSPTKALKGNRQAIHRHQRRTASISISASRRSLSSAASMHSVSPMKRTLGSELGSTWADSSFERDLDAQALGHSGDGDEGPREVSCDDDQTESTLGTSSSATPTRHKFGSGGPRRNHFVHDYDEGSTDRDDLSPVKTYARGRIAANFELDTTADLLPRGALRYAGPPDSETYEQLTRTASELPAVWESEEDLDAEHRHGRGIHSGKVSDSVLRRLEWREPYEGDSQHEDYWAKYPEDEDDRHGVGEAVLRLESKEMVAERQEQRERQELRRRPQRRKRLHPSKKQRCDRDTPQSRRMQALARLGLRDPHAYVSDDAADDDVSDQESCFTRSEGRPRGNDDLSYDSDGAYSERSAYSGSDDSADMSEFSYLSHNPSNARKHVARTDNTFYPLTRRARYAPRMLAHRFTDVAMQQLFTLITYVRFFVVLGLAIAYALWQGPKKTMGTQQRRRIS